LPAPRKNSPIAIDPQPEKTKSVTPKLTAQDGAAKTEEPNPETGTLRKHQNFRSRFLPCDRDIIVYIPAGYAPGTRRRYPVLYMQDGQNLFDPATAFGGQDWRMGQTADRAIAAGEVEPLIIVGIYNTGERRIREYTPSPDKKLGGGRAALYSRMLIEEIKPFIESEYRVRRGSANTGLGGSSLGGLVTLFVGLRSPEVFGGLAVLSPSVWWNRRWILGFVSRSRVEMRPRIWLDAGSAESQRAEEDARLLHGALITKGWQPELDLHFQVIEGGQHNEAAWAQRVGPFLKYLFPAGAAE
jgi:predicted alpha/beta superfamily hydrolase